MSQNTKKEDPRFTQALYDPRFHRLHNKNFKTKIDNRFQKVFTDKEKFDGAQNLYEQPNIQQQSEQKEIQKQDNSQKEEIDEEDDFISLEENVQRSEKSGKRLAMQNFDWKYLKSKEIYLIFSSFIEVLYPNQNVQNYLKSVDLYLSDFGKQQLEIEEIQGPRAVLEKALQVDQKGKKTFDQKILRKYELDRLKYYFAVITFENKFCAERIYDNYDNFEIELSGCRLDLRFAPDEMEINKKAIESCTNLNLEEKKRLPNFITKSIGHSEVELTWETQNNRNFSNLFNKDIENIQNKDLEQIIESQSEEDPENDQEKFQKMRENLLGNRQSIFQDFNKNNDEEDGLEIKFKVGFGNEGFDLEDNSESENENEMISKPLKKQQEQQNKKQKLSKRQFQQKARQKKIQKQKQKLEKESLNLLIDQNAEKDFKVDLQDQRFKQIYEDSNFAVDPTHKLYNINQGKEILKEKKKRRNNYKK